MNSNYVFTKLVGKIVCNKFVPIGTTAHLHCLISVQTDYCTNYSAFRQRHDKKQHQSSLQFIHEKKRNTNVGTH